MSVVETVVVLAGAAWVGVIAYGMWCSPVKPWVEEQMWRRDQRRQAIRLHNERMLRREAELEAEELERHYALPSAPDPEMNR